jgi:hypothetical protein
MRVAPTAAALLAAALVWTASAAAAVPHVRFVRHESNAIVKGTGFKPQEHLVVRLKGDEVRSKRVVAGADGTFRISLAMPPPHACGQYVLAVVRPASKLVSVKIGPDKCAPLDGDAGPPAAP